MRVRADPRVVAAQMGVALDLSPRIELARSGTHYEELGTILCRSLRRVLWAASLHGRHTGRAGAAPHLEALSAQARRPLITGYISDLAQYDGRTCRSPESQQSGSQGSTRARRTHFRNPEY